MPLQRLALAHEPLQLRGNPCGRWRRCACMPVRGRALDDTRETELGYSVCMRGGGRVYGPVAGATKSVAATPRTRPHPPQQPSAAPLCWSGAQRSLLLPELRRVLRSHGTPGRSSSPARECSAATREPGKRRVPSRAWMASLSSSAVELALRGVTVAGRQVSTGCQAWSGAAGGLAQVARGRVQSSVGRAQVELERP